MWTFEKVTDKFHFEQAWEWHEATPKFLRESCAIDRKTFLKKLASGVNYAGYENGIYKSLVYGEIRGDNTVEGHLYCKRRTNLDLLIATITFAKAEALKEFERVVVELPVKHKMLHGMILRAGFFDTGLSKLSKMIHGKLFETQFYVAAR